MYAKEFFEGVGHMPLWGQCVTTGDPKPLDPLAQRQSR